MNDHTARLGDRFEDLRFILRGNERGLATLAILALITAFCEAFLLAAIVQSISAMSTGRSAIDLSLGPISHSTSVSAVLGWAVVAAVLRGGLVAINALAGPRITAASRQRQRRRVFESYLAADWATQSAEKAGRLMQTMSSSVNDANTIIALLTQALPALLTLIVLLAVALILNPVVTGSLILFGLGVGLVLRPVSMRAHRAARADATARNATASHVSGVLPAGAEIAVLGASQGVLDTGLGRIAESERAFARAQGLKRLVSIAGQSVAFLLSAAGLWILNLGGWNVDFTTVGTIAVLLLRGAGLAQQVLTASSQYGAVAPFIEQIRTLSSYYESRRRIFGSHEFPTTFDITLTDVDYVYPGTQRSAVRVDAATFPQGSSTAIVGPSGSGKSTLVQLILRLRAPTHGEVRIGGIEAGSISEAAFSSRVAYVPQSPTLVPGTVFENIKFFRRDVTDQQVLAAARAANIHEDIERMPHSYDTVLDAHVDTLSGGQKQRLALARAMTTAPAILILDEPTSALDAANEVAVIDTLRQLHGQTTVIMITHKMTTVTHCDCVLLIKDGKMDEHNPGIADRESAAIATTGTTQSDAS